MRLSGSWRCSSPTTDSSQGCRLLHLQHSHEQCTVKCNEPMYGEVISVTRHRASCAIRWGRRTACGLRVCVCACARVLGDTAGGDLLRGLLQLTHRGSASNSARNLRAASTTALAAWRGDNHWGRPLGTIIGANIGDNHWGRAGH